MEKHLEHSPSTDSFFHGAMAPMLLSGPLGAVHVGRDVPASADSALTAAGNLEGWLQDQLLEQEQAKQLDMGAHHSQLASQIQL